MKMRWMVCGALLAALALAAPSYAQRNARDLEGALPEAPAGGAIQSATIDSEVVNGCYAISTGTVTASGGPGVTVGAEVLVYDSGILIDQKLFWIPADGTPRPFCAVYQQVGPAEGGEVAIGIWDEPDGTSYDYDIVAISDVCTGPAPRCAESIQAIPALSPAGLAALTLLLTAGAFGLLRRRRAPGA